MKFDDVSLLHADSRRCFARVHSCAFQAVCCSLHAPDAEKDDVTPGSIGTWWSDTTAVAKRVCSPDDVFICCVDGNLRITRPEPGVTGLNLSTRSNGGADQEHLIAFAIAMDLCIINTVDDYLADPDLTGTFVLKNGALPIRNDYVLTNRTEGSRKKHLKCGAT